MTDGEPGGRRLESGMTFGVQIRAVAFHDPAGTSSMTEPLQKVYISKRNSYLITCPFCRLGQEIPASHIPPDTPNPFECGCPCGKSFPVLLISFRTHPRKPVKLIGSFTLAEEAKKVQILCTVHDISLKGMRVTTDPVKNLSAETMLNASIILDDRPKTRLELPCQVRRLLPEKGLVMLGIEFGELSPKHQEALREYIDAFIGQDD
jgi:hypothetical protein